MKNHNYTQESYAERFYKFVVDVIGRDFQMQSALAQLCCKPWLSQRDLSILEERLSKFRDVVFDYVYEEDFWRYGGTFYYETPTE